MATHADHDAFAKQAAEAVYPVSDDAEDEEDDKGWGAKEWLTLALASGGLAAGIGAAYLYRKEIDKALGGRIFGDSREWMNAKLQDNLGLGAFGLGATAGIFQGTVPRLKKLPLGPDHGIQTTGGLINMLNKGGENAQPNLRAMGSSASISDSSGLRDPLAAGSAVHTFISGSQVTPSHPLAILSNKDLFNNPTLVDAVNKGTATGPLTPDPNTQNVFRRFFGNNRDPHLATQRQNADQLAIHAAEGQRKLDYNVTNPHQPRTLSNQEQAAIKLRDAFNAGLGAKAVNIPGVFEGIGKAQRIGTRPTIGGVTARAVGYGLAGSGASLLGEKIWGRD